MRKSLSAMLAIVCLLWMNGCSTVENKDGNDGKIKCSESDKAKQEKAAADLAKRKELAEKLMTVLKIGDSITRSFDQIKKSQLDGLTQQLKNRPLQNTEAAKLAAGELINKELSWNKIKNQFINIYAEFFSEEELDALIKFYESPIGRALVDKQPDIQQKSMAITRKLLIETTQQVHKMTREIIEKQQKAAASQTASETPAAQPAPTLPAAATPAAKNIVPLK